MLMEKLGSFFLDVLEVFFMAIAIFLILYFLVVQPHKIKGSSMEPNYHNGEYLLTDKLSYRFDDPKRGEVIVFEAPGTDGEEFIKRIIALPGEKVSIKGAKTFINGEALSETYLPENWPTPGGPFLSEGSEVAVPNNAYFVMGDNRTASSDSRVWGFVPRENIIGKAWFIYWPPKNIGLIEEVLY